MLDPRRLAISPIGWMNDDDPTLGGDVPLERCLDEMAAAGYRGCELGSRFPDEASAILAVLAPRRLAVAGAWCSLFVSQAGAEADSLARWRRHCARLAAAGAAVAVACDCGRAVHQEPRPVLAERPRFDAAEWRRLCSGLDGAGALAREHGLTLVYHPHIGTGIQSQQEVDRLLAGTDPEAVSLLWDSGHVYFAGDEPLAALVTHRERIGHVHLKDVRQSVLDRVRSEELSFLDAVRAGVFTVPGDGVLDFAPMIAALDDAGYTGWLVVEAEQDPARAEPLAYAKRARAYLEEIAER